MHQRLQSVLSSILGIAQDSVDESCSTETVTSWDSFKHLQLVIALEDEFDVQFSDHDIPNLTDYKKIEAALRALTAS